MPNVGDNNNMNIRIVLGKTETTHDFEILYPMNGLTAPNADYDGHV